MKTMTIQNPERYEAPKVKVKELRCRRVMCATSDFSIDDASTEGTE